MDDLRWMDGQGPGLPTRAGDGHACVPPKARRRQGRAPAAGPCSSERGGGSLLALARAAAATFFSVGGATALKEEGAGRHFPSTVQAGQLSWPAT